MRGHGAPDLEKSTAMDSWIVICEIRTMIQVPRMTISESVLIILLIDTSPN